MTREVGKISQRWRGTVPCPTRTISKFFLALFFCALVPLCVLLSTSLPAWGYVLQGPHLLLLMTENLGTASSLVVHQRCLMYDDVASDVQVEVSETLTYRFSTAFRSESTSPRLNRIHVDTLDAIVTIVDDRMGLQGEGLLDRYKDPLFLRSRNLLQKRLSDVGINPMVSSLGRFDGVPVYVLGAHYPDMSLPQLWLEKETFRPIRLLIPDPGGQGGVPGLEFRYLQWQKNRKLWYPMQIQCYQNGRLIREMIVDEMIMNPMITDGLFDIDQLRTQYGPAVDSERGLPSAGEPSDIQRALDDFKKRYEEQ